MTFAGDPPRRAALPCGRAAAQNWDPRTLDGMEGRWLDVDGRGFDGRPPSWSPYWRRPGAARSRSPGGSRRPAPRRSAPGTAAAALDRLPVKGRAPRTGFSRAAFGQSWRTSTATAVTSATTCWPGTSTARRSSRAPATAWCSPAPSPTPTPASRSRSNAAATTSDDVQIDHVVALSDAWQTGAQQLDPATREILANDPLNLVATAGRVNQAKGDSDAASWLPPHRPGRCAYVARQVAVKLTYRLWVTAAERDAIAGILAGCPDPAAADRECAARWLSRPGPGHGLAWRHGEQPVQRRTRHRAGARGARRRPGLRGARGVVPRRARRPARRGHPDRRVPAGGRRHLRRRGRRQAHRAARRRHGHPRPRAPRTP